MARHKWKPFALRGKIKECTVCGCIKKTTSLMPEYTMPNGIHQYGKAPECVVSDKVLNSKEVTNMDNIQTIMDAEQFYSAIIAPSDAEKSFIVPSWVISFAEKYADYKASVFYTLKLRIELENSEETIRKTLKRIDNIIEENG